MSYPHFSNNGLEEPRKTLKAVEVSNFEVVEDACISVGPLFKAASFYEF